MNTWATVLIVSGAPAAPLRRLLSAQGGSAVVKRCVESGALQEPGRAIHHADAGNGDNLTRCVVRSVPYLITDNRKLDYFQIEQGA